MWSKSTIKKEDFKETFLCKIIGNNRKLVYQNSFYFVLRSYKLILFRVMSLTKIEFFIIKSNKEIIYIIK